MPPDPRSRLLGSDPGPRPEACSARTPVIAEGCRFDGFLTFRGETWIDGDFRGEVTARGTLGLGQNARVGASVSVDELIVAGDLEGNVVARDRIELRSTARVRGNLTAPRILLEDGCVLQGHCRTVSAPTSDPAQGAGSEPFREGSKSP